MKKILVTGAAGFVAFHLIKRLAGQNFLIVGLDIINDYYDIELKFDRLRELGLDREKIAYNRYVESINIPNYQFIQLDLTDKENIFSLFSSQKFDYVINLAAQVGVRNSIDNPYSYLESNLSGFLNILEACRKLPVKHLIYASSSSVYGSNKKIPFEESDAVDNPISLYAATKRSNELIAHTYSHLYNIPSTGLRFFTVYGPWGRPDMAYFLFTKAILADEPIKVFNNGDMERDFTFVDDVTFAIENLIDRPPIKGTSNNDRSSFPLPASEIYNVGNNQPVTLGNFIGEIERALGKNALKELMPMQQGDVLTTFADVNKLVARIGEFNVTPLSQGIASFVDWYTNYYVNSNKQQRELVY